MGFLNKENLPRKPDRDPEVRRRVEAGAVMLERHRVLTKELAALERELATRR